MSKVNDLYQIQQYYMRAEGDRQLYLFNYSKGIDLPVDSRMPVSAAKAGSHTNVHIDYFQDIVSLKTGFMGQSITTMINIDESETVRLAEVKHQSRMFERLNNTAIMNSQSITWSSTSGVSHRLIYTEDGIAKLKNIEPWQVVYDYKESPLDPDRAFYFYETISLTGETTTHCDVYDKLNVTYYTGTKSQKSATQKKTSSAVPTTFSQVGEPQLHNFQEVPLFPIMNNDKMESDCEKSVELMDVYDEVVSDVSAEVKAMRLAYLKIWGSLYTGLDSEGNEIDVNTWLAQTSKMEFGDMEDGKRIGDAEFLEKNINDSVIENVLNRLRTHIYETSGSVDIKELASSERVFSIKAAMLRLENTASVAERYLRSALYKQTRLWTYWMRTYNNLQVDELEIDWTFKRTFPRDLEAEARTLAMLSNTVTLEDSLAAIGWENAKAIAKRKEDEVEDVLSRDIKKITGE